MASLFLGVGFSTSLVEEHRAGQILCIQSLSLIFSFLVENNIYIERTDFTITHKSVGFALKLLLNKIAVAIT